MAASSSEAPVAAATTGKLPATALGGDVGIAAPGNAGDGRGYVGVWSVDAAGCAAIGTPGVGTFAVITLSTFRDGPSALFGNWHALADGKTTLKSGDRSIALEQSTPDALTIDGKAYVRCTP